MDRSSEKEKSQITRIKSIIMVSTFGLFLFVVFVMLLFSEKKQWSQAERRPLETFPDLSYEEIVEGEFFEGFEDYALDHFVARDFWRSVKAISSQFLFGKLENNKLYYYQGGLYKIEEMNEASWVSGAEKLQAIMEKYPNMNRYYSVIPDKNTLAAPNSGRPAMDMAFIESILASKINNASYVDIKNLLTTDAFYATDIHWDQRLIISVADRILVEMNSNYNVTQDSFLYKEYTGFRGSYYGHAALPVGSEILTTLYGESFADLKIQHFVTTDEGEMLWEPMPLYQEDAFLGTDPYDIFLGGGTEVLVKIENPNATSGKKLYLFRDSFGSALAPLLVGGYEEIVLIDLRYVKASYLPYFVDFEDGNDMLFLYSTHVLNDSQMLME